MRPGSNRLICAALLPVAALWTSSCAVPLGPGYTIDRQSVAVRFVPAPEPRIELTADYRLRNTGNQPLNSLELRLPRENLLGLETVAVTWDAQAIPFERSSDPAGDVLRIQLSESWPIKQTHALHVQYGIGRGRPQEPQLDFPADSFYLPPGAWLVTLLPSKGTFARGGLPPKEWTLSLRVPADFVARAPGNLRKHGTKNGEGQFEFQQRASDPSPFVVAGRYHQQEYRGSPCTVILWKKTPIQAKEVEPLVREIQRIAHAYDLLFGSRDKHVRPIWIVDLPLSLKRWSSVIRLPDGSPGFAEGLAFAEPPPDFGFIFTSESGEAMCNQQGIVREIARSLAKTWLGYGRYPGFTEMENPMAHLPDYAAEVAIPAGAPQGSTNREQGIRKWLKMMPVSGQKRTAQEPAMTPSKGLLFFYALEDQYGRERLHAALRHMVQARRGQACEVQDLIAALEQETHQDVGAFFRRWLKHPGIPEEFRMRYEGTAAPQITPEEKQK
jgi:hypothetical protein